MTTLATRLLDSRFRLSTQLYLGIGGAVALTVVASLVGLVSFDHVAEVQNRVNEGSVPEMVTAFGVAQQSGALVAAGPRLTAAATPEELARTVADVSHDRQAFEAQVAALPDQGAEESRFERIRAQGNALLANVGAIEESVAEGFLLAERSQTLRAEIAALQRELAAALIPAIDDQLFYTMTGYRELGEAPAPRAVHGSEDEFDRYRHMAGLQANATIAIELLASAFDVSDIALLEPLRERFEASAGKIERALSALGATPLHARIAPALARLVDLGLGGDQGFDLRAQELVLSERQAELLASNSNLAVELAAEAEGLVSAAREGVQDAAQASSSAISTGGNLLLAISVFSIVGAALISWLFVGRVLMRRLGRLSDRMRRMAEGDIEAEVVVDGRGEVADMAAALEVFRRHALEVQRLNLVEKLAEELKGKNEQLEDALANLQRAQDQIVMQEKLAALGELTAGVAHEIRNPLNFVKNFSDVTEQLLEELLEELQTVLPEPVDGKEDESSALIREISADITENLRLIREHGERANQIVQHMLSMGRDSGGRQPTDINALLDEHVRLAYHSARASDESFQLDIVQDFDPAVGSLDVVTQDVGRVFLNLVGNACQATAERQRAEEAADAADTGPDGSEGSAYEPTLALVTRRSEEGIEIRIRDNGSGIPPDIIDDIFNPFFTTKPPDQGTGLGLALSSDIVRQHGGEIRVESEPGAFTEFIVKLPVQPPQQTEDDAAEDEAELEDEHPKESPLPS